MNRCAHVRDRFQQFAATARELLSDFREVEENFRLLDRGVREQIAAWEGSRGSLLDDVFGERDAIADSDQGVSFRAFWDFLMSADRQEEFDRLLETVMTMPALRSPDPTLRNVLRDWLVAADSVQATVAQLSQQLRRGTGGTPGRRRSSHAVPIPDSPTSTKRARTHGSV